MGWIARERSRFWWFKLINPIFDSVKNGRWQALGTRYDKGVLEWSHWRSQFCCRPVRGPPMGTKPSRRKFWDFSVLFDAKINPSQISLSEIDSLLSISLPSTSILRKNQALTPKIDRERNRRSKAPGTIPLEPPKCTTFGTFLRPSTPPLAILDMPKFCAKYI